MLLRLALIITTLALITGCEKYPTKNGAQAFLPVKMYVTGENRDTTGATRYEFTYNSSDYLTGRDKYEAGGLTESFRVNYTRNLLIENVILQAAGKTDTFFYRYDLNAKVLEVRKTSADGKSGMVRTYIYIVPPPDRDFLYPKSTLGRIQTITDSLFSNNQYSRKLHTEMGYGMSDRDISYIAAERTESFPGAPDVSTIAGIYKTTISSYKNPFAFVSPDLFELPDELAQPWPFTRKGFVLSYQLSSTGAVTPELDTYEVAKSEPRFGVPEQVRKTMTGRRSGQITVQYFIFEYRAG